LASARVSPELASRYTRARADGRQARAALSIVPNEPVASAQLVPPPP
jgi:hypothetical protein